MTITRNKNKMTKENDDDDHNHEQEKGDVHHEEEDHSEEGALCKEDTRMFFSKNTNARKMRKMLHKKNQN